MRQAVLSPNKLNVYFPDYLTDVSRVISTKYHPNKPVCCHAITPTMSYYQVMARELLQDSAPDRLLDVAREARQRDTYLGRIYDMETSVSDKAYRTGQTEWEAEMDILHRPINKEETARRRYFPRSTDKWDGLGPRFGPGFSLYESVLDGSQLRIFRRITNELEISNRVWRSDRCLRKVLKAVETWAKKDGDAVPGWKGLIGWGTLGGYVSAAPDEMFLADVTKWVTTGPGWEDPLYKIPGWDGCFQEALEMLFSDVEPVSSTYTPLEYLYSLDWARAGSTDVKSPVFVTMDGQTVPIRNTKDLVSLGIPPEDLLKYITHDMEEDARALVKREVEKGRAVLVTGLSPYLKMAYILFDIEQAMRHTKYNSLFLTGEGLAELWDELGRDSIDIVWKMPLDQSHFDHNISLSMIRMVLGKIRAKCLTQCQKDIVDLIIRRICDKPCIVRVGEHRVQVEKGVLSGWRTTALFDTIINFGQIVGSAIYLKRKAVIYSLPLKGLYVQGDDCRLLLNNPAVGVAICEVLIECGFEINRSKTWLSIFRDEYLRKVAENGRVSGYLSRTINALMWRNPIRPQPASELNALTACAKQWVDVAGRGGRKDSVRRHLLKEISHLTRRTIYHDVVRWMATPKWGGGLEVPLELLGLSEAPKYLKISETQLLKPVQITKLRGLETITDAMGITDPEFYRDTLLPTVVNMLQPFQDNVLYDFDSTVITTSEVQVPGMSIMYPQSMEALPPHRANFKKGLLGPRWLYQKYIRNKVETLGPGEVNVYLDAVSGMFSAHIYRNHGRKTWLDWIDGSLDLPIRSWVPWDEGYLGGKMSRIKRMYLRRMLGTSRAFRGERRRGLEYAFWMQQRSPAEYSHSKMISC